MYKVTVNAATLVQCDPALGHSGWTDNSLCRARVQGGYWTSLVIISISSVSISRFVGSSPLLLMVKSPASGAQESGSNPSSAS